MGKVPTWGLTVYQLYNSVVSFSKLTMFPNHTNSKAGKATPAQQKQALEVFFPQFIFTPGLVPGQVTAQLVPTSGIPMRDYFAAKVAAYMTSRLPSKFFRNDDFPIEVALQKAAKVSYALADAMLEARKQPLRGNPDNPENNSGSTFHGDHMTPRNK